MNLLPFCEFIAIEGTFVAHKKGITQHISRWVQFPITLPFWTYIRQWQITAVDFVPNAYHIARYFTFYQLLYNTYKVLTI